MWQFTVLIILPLVLSQQQNRLYDEIALESGVVDPRTSSEATKLFFLQPGAVTNSHKPQYLKVQDTQASGQINSKQRLQITKVPNHRYPEENSFDESLDEEYRPSHHIRNKQDQIKAILVKILEKNDQKKKFAEVLPILKVMTPEQKLVMATLVGKQLTADAKNPPLNLAQVRSMFGNNPNTTSDLMLPLILDIANMFKTAKDSLKLENRPIPQAQMLRRSFPDSDSIDPVAEAFFKMTDHLENVEDDEEPEKTITTSRTSTEEPKKSSVKISTVIKNVSILKKNDTISQVEEKTLNNTESDQMDVFIDMGNETEFENLPIAEKLRALNRFIDRNGNFIIVNRPPWGPQNPKVATRKNPNNIPVGSNRRRFMGHNRYTLIEMARQKCDLFTNSLCLDTLDYPMEAISKSIHRNGGAMESLLADFPDISADSAVDGVSAKQENKYTKDHYLNSLNRREDGVSTPVATSGFMCPSTIKYARPQKARATSGQWKYIVNTGEHTQTLRLEKCLRPKESCTYLTDNFKSTCVQVYNYHRLLTWDQQNGLHMDIFKVPTCCSCHIEGYSVSFPPHLGRPSETTSERFPGEDIAHDSDLSPFEDIKSSVRHPSKYAPIKDKYSLDADSTQNFILGSHILHEPEENPALQDLKHLPIPNQFNRLNNNFHTDILQHQSSNIRNIKKPNPIRGAIDPGLSSYLEPPSKPAETLTNNFQKTPERPTKFKNPPNNHFKRGTQPPQPQQKRPVRRPQRKKHTDYSPDQLVGASELPEKPTIINVESFEDLNDSSDEYDRSSSEIITNRPTRPKLASSKITIKNVAASSTERPQIRSRGDKSTTENSVSKEQTANRRVNYNYHPIIDFFENNRKANEEAAARIDSGNFYYENEETDWRPMTGPGASVLKVENKNDGKSNNQA